MDFEGQAGDAMTANPEHERQSSRERPTERWNSQLKAIVAGFIAMAIAAGVLVWTRTPTDETGARSQADKLTSSSATTERPAVIVLPFANLSGRSGSGIL